LIESAQAMIGVVADHTMIVIPGADHIQAPARPELADALRTFFLRQ
jgi:hypothetical protein